MKPDRVQEHGSGVGSQDKDRSNFYAFNGEKDEYDNQLFELIDMIG
jgi:hypothetical protein